MTRSTRGSQPRITACSWKNGIKGAELSNEEVSTMIKRKGVCDVCHTEFELDEGSFAIKIVEDKHGPSPKKWTITVTSCVDGCLEEGFSHVCGMACLYEALSDVVEKKAQDADFKIIGYDGIDDSNTRVFDLRDKKKK